jgi:hypothetical protein
MKKYSYYMQSDKILILMKKNDEFVPSVLAPPPAGPSPQAPQRSGPIERGQQRVYSDKK